MTKRPLNNYRWIQNLATVEKAKKTIRQKEALQEQGKELESEKRKTESLEELEKTIAELQASMDELRREKGKGHRGGPWQQGGAGGKLITSKSATCSRCGYGQHSCGGRCPAADARCHKCNRKGHFSSKFRKSWNIWSKWELFGKFQSQLCGVRGW